LLIIDKFIPIFTIEEKNGIKDRVPASIKRLLTNFIILSELKMLKIDTNKRDRENISKPNRGDIKKDKNINITPMKTSIAYSSFIILTFFRITF